MYSTGWLFSQRTLSRKASRNATQGDKATTAPKSDQETASDSDEEVVATFLERLRLLDVHMPLSQQVCLRI